MTQHPAATEHVPNSHPYQVPRPLDGSRLLARGLGIIGLSAIAVVHIAELPDTWRQTPGLGAMFAVLALAASVNAVALLHADDSRVWHAAGLVALAPIGGYLVTRSVALPFDRDDVGNWLEPSVLVAVFVEFSLLALCSHTLRHGRHAGR